MHNYGSVTRGDYPVVTPIPGYDAAVVQPRREGPLELWVKVPGSRFVYVPWDSPLR